MTRPLPAGVAPGTGLTPTNQSAVHAVVGIIRRPRSTFASVVSHPKWGIVLLLTTLVSAGAGVGLMTTGVGRQALVDQWERTAVAFGQEIDDESYARLQAASDRGAVGYALLSALLGGPLLTIAVAGLMKVALRGRATFAQVMAVVTHAGIILAIRQLIAAPVGYIRESTSSAAAVGSLFSALDEASPVARFLGALDLFVIWWAVVLAIGVSVLNRQPARPVATLFVGVYAALALLLAIAMTVAGGSV